MSDNIRNRRYIVAGIALYIVILIVLMAVPGTIFSPMVTFLDTDLNSTSDIKVPVKPMTDFGNIDQVSTFPKVIGKWQGYDYDMAAELVSLNADIILTRYYQTKNSASDLFFIIVQSKTASSFHPPKVCFISQGYNILEEDNVQVKATNAAWIKGPTSIILPLKKIVIAKNSSTNQIIERHVILFCYVKGNQFYDDTVTMIEVQALAPLKGLYDKTLVEEQDFFSQTLPLMFSPVDNSSKWQPVYQELAGYGLPGYIFLGFLLLGPAIIISYPKIRKR